MIKYIKNKLDSINKKLNEDIKSNNDIQKLDEIIKSIKGINKSLNNTLQSLEIQHQELQTIDLILSHQTGNLYKNEGII
jgi:uncharacterized ParB-like nuclease family protein